MESVLNTTICNNLAKDCSVSSTTQQEINDLMEIVKAERLRYIEHKITCEVITECITDSTINDDLRTKINSIMFGNVENCITLPSKSRNPSCSTLLGLSHLHTTDLTYEERRNLKQLVEQRLINKSNSITDKLRNVIKQNDITSSSTSVNSLSLDVCDKVLIEQKSKLNHLQNLYIENLLKQNELLEEIAKLRIEKMPELSVQKLEQCNVVTNINNLKSVVVEMKNRIATFSETSSSLEAYKQLLEDINKQKLSYQEQISALEELKEKYKQVDCKEYNEILKNYIKYKNAIEKFKILKQQIS